jgi:tRNA(fMet)-specific endonuclease VapC
MANGNRSISTATEVLVPAIVLGELRYGFQGSSLQVENETKLDGFLRHTRVRVVSVGDATSRVFAHLKHFLRREVSPIPENDIWIAALAVENSVPVLTSDARFSNLPQVSRLPEWKSRNPK